MKRPYWGGILVRYYPLGVILYVLMFCLVVCPLTWANDAPLYIQSDQMEIEHNQKMVIFTGHVNAKQNNIVIQADRMEVFYDEGKQDPRKEYAKEETLASVSIVKMIAEGNVVITQDQRIARGEKAVFWKEKGKVVLTGHPELQEGQNVIKGEKIIVFINENKMIVIGGKQPVEAVIYPKNGE